MNRDLKVAVFCFFVIILTIIFWCVSESKAEESEIPKEQYRVEFKIVFNSVDIEKATAILQEAAKLAKGSCEFDFKASKLNESLVSGSVIEWNDGNYLTIVPNN